MWRHEMLKKLVFKDGQLPLLYMGNLKRQHGWFNLSLPYPVPEVHSDIEESDDYLSCKRHLISLGQT